MFNYADIVLILILMVITGLAVRSIYHNRKRGGGCNGCPHASNCMKKQCDYSGIHGDGRNNQTVTDKP